MRYPRCDVATPDAAKYCIEYGASLRPRSLQCDAEVLPLAKLYAKWGTPLGGPPATPLLRRAQPLVHSPPSHSVETIFTSKAALEGECKQVTVPFADLDGSWSCYRAMTRRGSVMSDLVIRQARICEGTGSPSFVGTLGVTDGRITDLGRETGLAGRRIIDADGLVVASGVIDPHTHDDAQIAWDPLLTCSPTHGVTTVVMSNCGVARETPRGCVSRPPHCG